MRDLAAMWRWLEWPGRRCLIALGVGTVHAVVIVVAVLAGAQDWPLTVATVFAVAAGVYLVAELVALRRRQRSQ